MYVENDMPAGVAQSLQRWADGVFGVNFPSGDWCNAFKGTCPPQQTFLGLIFAAGTFYVNEPEFSIRLPSGGGEAEAGSTGSIQLGGRDPSLFDATRPVTTVPVFSQALNTSGDIHEDPLLIFASQCARRPPPAPRALPARRGSPRGGVRVSELWAISRVIGPGFENRVVRKPSPLFEKHRH